MRCLTAAVAGAAAWILTIPTAVSGERPVIVMTEDDLLHAATEYFGIPTR